MSSQGWRDAAFAALDRYLSPTSRAPLAVGLSGGGDSTALLHLAVDWAARAGRSVTALTVDHGLSPASGDWTRRCAALAAGLGAAFVPLAWTGPKPAAGLPAAARAARHALLADAARACGARVVLLGHTANDLAESAWMRATGSTLADPRAFAPSPAWPAGRGVFLLRPLLGARRAELRDWLTSLGAQWIEDPANADPRFARSRARAVLQTLEPSPPTTPPPLRSPTGAVCDAATGLIVLPRDASAAEVAAACLCAAGTSVPPRGARLVRLLDRIAAGGPAVAGLAGARIEIGETVRVYREPGEAARGGLAPLTPSPGHAGVWDGRFEVETDRPGLTVRALGGLAARLPKPQQEALAGLPAMVRGALPAVVDAAGAVTCPILARDAAVRITALAPARFAAAIGIVNAEPED